MMLESSHARWRSQVHQCFAPHREAQGIADATIAGGL